MTCWRTLADHVRDSVRKGEPVLVHGRLRTDVWQREDGQSSVTHVVEATYVGHDLTRGTAVFVKAARPSARRRGRRRDAALKELLHDPGVDLPQLDSLGQSRTPAAGAPARPARPGSHRPGRLGRGRADFSRRPAPRRLGRHG